MELIFPPNLCRCSAVRLPPIATAHRRLRRQFLSASGDNSSTDGAAEESAASSSTSSPKANPTQPLQIRYRSISKKQARKREEDLSAVAKAPPPKKSWEEMTLGEKALELYVGEKGLLFWLNKFAYASIFIIIGGWIVFRFVGPSLGLYQLDGAPLSPSSLF